MTYIVRTSLDWVDRNHTVVLAIIMLLSLVHLSFSLMLVVSSASFKRALLIPWMVSHMLNIIIMIITFTCWTFISFFIDLLLAIVFPVVGGLVLGVWIVMWRLVYLFFNTIRESQEQCLILEMKDTGS